MMTSYANRLAIAAVALSLLMGSAWAEGLNGRDKSLACNFYLPNVTTDNLLGIQQRLKTEPNSPDNQLMVVNRCTRRSESLSIKAINVTKATGDFHIVGTVQNATGKGAAKRSIDITQ